MNVDVVVEGIGVWSTHLPDWRTARAVLRGDIAAAPGAMAKPAPSLLPANERRRAPDSVLLAFEIAQQACAMAGRDPALLPAVFASAYGDLAISDYLCATLVRAPQDLSPTKFHNSVHNAAAGYWAIATGCMANTSAISAAEHSVGAGLLEAALLAQSESSAVVYAAYDGAASGALADVVTTRTLFGIAFVLAPRGSGRGAALRLRVRSGPAARLAPEPPLLQSLHADNPAAQGLPLLAALASERAQTLTLGAGPQTILELEIGPWQN